MSVKKFLVLTAAGIASLGATAVIAGGPDMMAPPAPVDYSGYYIEGDVGYGYSNWGAFEGGILNTSFAAPNPGTVTSNNTFVWGGDFGYQFNRYLSVEAGWYKLGTAAGDTYVELSEDTDAEAEAGVQISSWMLYFAGKIAVPIWSSLDVFGKAGVVWRHLTYTGNALSNANFTTVIPEHNHYWAPFFAFGFQWWFNPNWSVNVQYLHVPANTERREISAQAPKANLIVGGVGYKFAV